MSKIAHLNSLMREFIGKWEEINTEEVFFELKGSELTNEIKLSISNNTNKFNEIQEIIDDEDAIEEIIEKFSLIDHKVLDTLIDFYDLDISKLSKRLKKKDFYDATEEIKIFISEHNK